MHVLFDLDGLATAFAALLETCPVRIDEAIGAFRQRFERVGMFGNALYPGIAEAVAEPTWASVSASSRRSRM
jgi:hypothetical protein